MGVNCLCAFPTPIITLDLVYYHKFRDALIEHIYKTKENTRSEQKSNLSLYTHLTLPTIYSV